MTRIKLSWLQDRVASAIIRRGMNSPFFFPARPLDYASVVAKLDNLATEMEVGQPSAGLGQHIRILDLITGEKRVVRLSQPNKAELTKSDVSILSPLGSALLAKKVGEEVNVMILGYEYKFKVLSIPA